MIVAETPRNVTVLASAQHAVGPRLASPGSACYQHATVGQYIDPGDAMLDRPANQVDLLIDGCGAGPRKAETEQAVDQGRCGAGKSEPVDVLVRPSELADIEVDSPAPAEPNLSPEPAGQVVHLGDRSQLSFRPLVNAA